MNDEWLQERIDQALRGDFHPGKDYWDQVTSWTYDPTKFWGEYSPGQLTERQWLVVGVALTGWGGLEIGGQLLFTNLVSTGLRSALITTGVQAIFKGPKNIDIADVAISAVSGDAWIASAVLSSLVDVSVEDGVKTAYDKGLYNTAVDMATGAVFGGANFAGSTYLGSVLNGANVKANVAAGIAVDTTIQSYGELFNGTLNQTIKP